MTTDPTPSTTTARETTVTENKPTSENQTIWRFRFDLADEVTLTGIPRGAKFLRHVHVDDVIHLSVWAVVDPTAPTEDRQLHVRGTGHRHGVAGEHLGTVVTDAGLVWHVFEASR